MIWRPRKAVRMAALSAACAFALCAGTAAVFRASAAEADVQRAYDTARLCYVANGHVYSAFKDAGDTANAQLFEGKGKKAFDLAYFYGNMLHLSQEQIGADLDRTTETELRKLVGDNNYLTTVARTCKSSGLM